MVTTYGKTSHRSWPLCRFDTARMRVTRNRLYPECNNFNYNYQIIAYVNKSWSDWQIILFDSINSISFINCINLQLRKTELFDFFFFWLIFFCECFIDYLGQLYSLECWKNELMRLKLRFCPHRKIVINESLLKGIKKLIPFFKSLFKYLLKFHIKAKPILFVLWYCSITINLSVKIPQIKIKKKVDRVYSFSHHRENNRKVYIQTV